MKKIVAEFTSREAPNFIQLLTPSPKTAAESLTRMDRLEQVRGRVLNSLKANKTKRE